MHMPDIIGMLLNGSLLPTCTETAPPISVHQVAQRRLEHVLAHPDALSPLCCGVVPLAASCDIALQKPAQPDQTASMLPIPVH
jgi:hypothetical protein